MSGFVTAVNCIDGRAQKPVIAYMENVFGADYVDMITEPGPNKILSEGKDMVIIESIKRRLEVSCQRNGSRVVAVVGHYDCKANPADEATQKEQICKAVEVVNSWGLVVDKVVGLWLDEAFKVSVVEERQC